MADNYKFTQSASELQELMDSIGTDDLTTTAQTLTVAVNELDTEVESNASDISTLQGNITTLQGQGIKYFASQVVSVASSAEILRITDSSITTNTVVLRCDFADTSAISGDVSWTSYAGYISFTGTCTSATTANVTLGVKTN